MHTEYETLTTLRCSGTKRLLTSWLLVFRHEERETQFLLCWLFLHRPQSTPQLARPGPARPRVKSQLTAFFKNRQILSPSLLWMTSFTPQSYFLSGVCGDLEINDKTPNRMLTSRLPHTKYINASPRIRLHASIRLKIRKKRKIIKSKVANGKRSHQN